MRSIGKGATTFGPVNVPVTVYSSAEGREIEVVEFVPAVKTFRLELTDAKVAKSDGFSTTGSPLR
jgi:non-homologous end joining protein Ku